MLSVDLVTSVPDLHTARILASAGVSYISFLQTNAQLNEIIPWIEGPEIFVQLTDQDLPVPRVRGLIIPYTWYNLYSFMDKKVFWITDQVEQNISSDMIYTNRNVSPFPEHEFYKSFYHYTIINEQNIIGNLSWIDFEDDLSLFERLFLD